MSISRLSFELPTHLETNEPPEARGLARDAVRMLVSHRGTGELLHSTFRDLPLFVRPGDLVVVNTSATIPAAIDGYSNDHQRVVIHLSTHLEGELWVVEPRRPLGRSSERWRGDEPPRSMSLGRHARLELLEPYRDSDRLWTARVLLPRPALEWLADHGRPIHYGYVKRPWPIEAYQNVYATEPGSAEMPSAGRPFTPELIARLVAMRVGVTPVVLHAGVASLEADERPFPERVKVPAFTAHRVNGTHRTGGRVIAVGTTVVRALESASNFTGRVEPLDAWTDLVITPERGVRVVDGMLTGWHRPDASHLLMLETIAGRELLESSYLAGLDGAYRWHEFGDTHLILP